VGELIEAGYRVQLVCSCGAAFERWVTLCLRLQRGCRAGGLMAWEGGAKARRGLAMRLPSEICGAAQASIPAPGRGRSS
jgi:hypothetical protein